MLLRLFLVLVAAVSLAGCDLNNDGGYGEGSRIRHYVIEAKVRTPSGVVTGRSAVVARIQPITKEDHQTRPVRIKMEAIPLPLPDGRILFIMSAGRHYDWDMQAPWVPLSKQKLLEDGAKIEMSRDRLPDFGFFKEMEKPNTLVRFSYDHFERNMGKEIKILSITVRRSDEKNDNRILEMMPYLKKHDLDLRNENYCNGPIEKQICATKLWFYRSA